MADTEVFDTFDVAATPVGFNMSPEVFDTFDAGAAVVPMAGFSQSTVTFTFATFPHAATPGRWRVTDA